MILSKRRRRRRGKENKLILMFIYRYLKMFFLEKERGGKRERQRGKARDVAVYVRYMNRNGIPDPVLSLILSLGLPVPRLRKYCLFPHTLPLFLVIKPPFHHSCLPCLPACHLESIFEYFSFACNTVPPSLYVSPNDLVTSPTFLPTGRSLNSTSAQFLINESESLPLLPLFQDTCNRKQ